MSDFLLTAFPIFLFGVIIGYIIGVIDTKKIINETLDRLFKDMKR